MVLKQIIFYQFISIHINSAKDNTVRGVEVWQYSNTNEKPNKFLMAYVLMSQRFLTLETEV